MLCQNVQEVLKTNRWAKVYTNTEKSKGNYYFWTWWKSVQKSIMGKAENLKMLKDATQNEDIRVNNIYDFL